MTDAAYYATALTKGPLRMWKKGVGGNKLLRKRRNSTVYGMVLASESPLQGLPRG
jgi:hypothetical protein